MIGLFVGGSVGATDGFFVGDPFVGGIEEVTGGVVGVGGKEEILVDPSNTKALQNATSSKSIRCCSVDARRCRCPCTPLSVAIAMTQHQEALKQATTLIVTIKGKIYVVVGKKQ